MIGGPVREARNNAGLTQAELAEAADVSDETIRRTELAKYEPSLSTMVAVADALHVPIEGLTGRGATTDPAHGLTPLGERLAREAALLPPVAQRALLRLL